MIPLFFSNINNVGVSFGPDINFNTFLSDLKSIEMSRLWETEKGEHYESRKAKMTYILERRE